MKNKKKCSTCKNYLDYSCFTKDIRHTDESIRENINTGAKK